MQRDVRATTNSVSVRLRVLGLAALSVAVAVVLGGVYLLGDRASSASLARRDAFEVIADKADALKVGTLEMRRREKDFLLRKDLSYAKAYQAEAEQVSAALADLQSLPSAAPIGQALTKLAQDLGETRKQFDRVVEMNTTLGLTETEGLEGQLRKAVHAVEKEINAAGLDALTVKMLMMRRHEKDFMMRGGDKYIKSVDERRAEFDALLAQTSLDAATKAKLSSEMDAYQSSFRDYAKTAEVLGSEAGRLSELFSGMEPTLEAVFQFAAEGMVAAEKQFAESRSAVWSFFMGALGVSLALALLLGFLISRSITGPLGRMTETMSGLAEGDTSTEVPYTSSSNELGRMARAIEVFRVNAIRNRELEAEQARRDQLAAAERRQLMQSIADEFDANVGEIVETVSAASTELSATAGAMAEVSSATNERAMTVSAAAEQASANVQMVASATEEMSASVNEINAQVERASVVAKRASGDVARTAEQMEALARMADRIGEVISLISDIAAQTNLLALNATIESARAGEAGKGFAVVASEVKQLANQTASATDDISKLIAEIQGQTRTSVQAIGSVGQVIRDLDEMAAAIAAAVNEQGATTREVARNVSEAAGGTRHVSANINAVSDAAQETMAASTQMRSSAESLSDQASRMKLEVSRFLANIRAA
jgi:methyl-accepting chemotaxis protein